MTKRSRIVGAAIVLLLLGLVLSACAGSVVAENWPGLTVDGDTVYAISGAPQQVYIVDATNRSTKATFMPDGAEENRAAANYWSPVTVGGGLAFAGFFQQRFSNNGLYAFDPETGQQQWWVEAESEILSAPTYADGVVYYGTTGGQVYAVDVESRSVKAGWPFEVGSPVWASPLVADGRVYVVSMDHILYCLDAETGEEKWQQEVGGALATQPLLEDGILYAGAFDGKVHALKADSGEPVEGFDFQAGNWIWSTPLMIEGQLFVTALDGFLYALDPATGEVLPPYPYDSGAISQGRDVIRANPIQVGDTILIATEKGHVVAVEGGQRICSWPSGAPESAVYTTPVLSGEKVYLIQLSGEVHTLDAATLDSGVCAVSELFSPPTSD